MQKNTLLTISPTRIFEGTNLINKNTINKFKHIFGENPIIIIKNDVLKKFPQFLKLKIPIIKFEKECSQKQANTILKSIKNKKISSVIGIGGGKTLDQAKFIAHKIAKPIITIPTSPATGAAASALSAMYTEQGANIGYTLFDSSPNLVILDYSIIIDSPPSFFRFGIADALAKYYESMASTKKKTTDVFVDSALDLAKQIKKYLFKNAHQALIDAKNKNITPVLKNIIKINIILAPLVGGFGGENCRAVASHAFNNAMTQLPKMQKFMHGEVVALGNIFQLMLENTKKSKTELKKLLKLYAKIKLMQDFSYFNTILNEQELKLFLDHILSTKETLKNMPREIKRPEIIKCLKELKVI